VVALSGEVGLVDAFNALGELQNASFPSPVPSANLTGANESRLSVEDTAGPLHIFAPIFEVKSAGQSLPLIDASNMVSITLATNCDFAEGSTVTLTGLTETSPTTNGNTTNGTLSVTSSPQLTFVSGAGAWDQEQGELVLTVGPASLLRNTTYKVSFWVQNPAEPQAAPDVTVEGVVEIVDAVDAMGVYHAATYNAPVHPRLLDPANESRLSVDDTAAPLMVFAPTFPTKKIGQSMPLVAASNLISVTIQSNCDFAEDSYITISGLTGTQAPAAFPSDQTLANLSVTSMPHNTFKGNAGGVGVWNETEGTLVVTVGADKVLKNTTYLLSFWVRNGDTEQPAPVITISGTVDPAGTNDVLGVYQIGEFPAPVHAAGMLPANETRLGVPDTAAPGKTFEATFPTREVAQSFPLADASNMLTVTLRTNVDMAPGSNVTFTSLTGTQTPSTNALPVTSNPAGGCRDAGLWEQASGRLTLTVGAEGLLENTTYRFSFWLRNTNDTQEAVTVDIAGTVALRATLEAGGGYVTAADTSPAEALNLTTVDEYRLGLANHALPLLVLVPIFPSNEIAQHNPLCDASNQITVTLTANSDFPSGSVLTLSGLTGAQNEDTPTFDITSAHPQMVIGGTGHGGAGVWGRDDGTLALTIANNTMPVAREDNVLTFWLRNIKTEQPAPNVSIAATIATEAFDANGVWQVGEWSAHIPPTPAVPSNETRFGIPGAAAPLGLTIPVFTRKQIGQTNPLAGASNMLTTTLATNCDMPEWSTLTLSGLTGTQTADAPDLQLATMPIDTYQNSTGEWRNAEGVLEWPVADGVRTTIAQEYEVSIWARNPSSPQPSPEINCWGEVHPAGEEDAAGVYHTGVFTAPIYETPVVKDNSSWLGVEQGRVPLLVMASVPIVRSIEQSNPLWKASNLISVALEFNHDVAAGSRISLTGLTGTWTPDTDAIAIFAGQAPRAVWVGPQGCAAPVVADSAWNFSTSIDRTFPQEAGAANISLSAAHQGVALPGFDASGVWRQAEGVLVLTVGADQLRVATQYQVVFELRNGDVERPAGSDISVSASIEAVVPECKNSTFPYRLLQAPEHYWCDIIQQVYYGDTLPIGMTVIYEERFSVPNASLPLATLKPVLETIFMRQFFFYPRFRNLLTVSLKANADLLVNTTLTISGLAGTLSPSGTLNLTEDLTANPLPVFEPTGAWTQSSGTLVLTLAPGRSLRRASYGFSIDLWQPVDNSLYPRVLLHRGEVECGVFDSPVDQQTIDQATDAIHAIEGASAPLFTYQPQVTVAEIVQHSPFPAVPNQVVFKLAFNLDLPSPSLITIHGLASARSVAPSNDWPCQVLPGGALEVCEWDRPASADDFSGTLVLKTEGLFRGGVGAVRDQVYTVNVSLVNPPEAHTGDRIWVEARIFAREQVAPLLNVSFSGANGTLLSVPLPSLGAPPYAAIHTASPATCLSMAEACSLPTRLHECAFSRGAQHATEMAGCLERCNISAGKMLPFAEASACCGLQCLDACWTREISPACVLSAADSNGTDATGTDGNGTNGSSTEGSIAQLSVFLVRRSPFDNATEIEHAANVRIKVALSPPCVTPSSPWECNATSNSSGLSGALEAKVDMLTGRATFTNLAILTAPPGRLSLLFSLVPGDEAAREHFELRYGSQDPPGLLAAGWPGAEASFEFDGIDVVDDATC